jgi:AcrR family transcriptional regulator
MQAEQRREQLLDATKAIAGDHGFHAISIEAVARRAGITRPVVYGHFGDLPGLLEALVEREAARALAQLAALLPGELEDGAARDQLLRALEGYLRAVAADPGTWRLVLMPPEGAPEVLREHITRGREAVIAYLASRLGPGALPGDPLPDPELLARLLSAISDEAARLMLQDPRAYPVERLLLTAGWLLDRFAGAEREAKA